MTNPGTEIVTVERAALTVFGTDEPRGIVERVTQIAGPLADFIKQQGMTSNISGKEYVLAEGWSFMGAMLGVSPVCTRVSELRGAEGQLVGFEAHVELRTRDGALVGGAIAECARSESNWRDRDDFALKSMAQTRATGKAYRMAFGFVMKAAGYEATPAEEMPTPGQIVGRGLSREMERPPQPRAQSTGDKRNGVSRPPDELKSVSDLLGWAKYHHNIEPARVAEILVGSGAVAGDIAPAIQGDFSGAAQAITDELQPPLEGEVIAAKA